MAASEQFSVDRAKQLREGVRRAYSAAAEQPTGEHPFPVGRAFAASVGYPADLLSTLPPVAVDSFAGVSNVSLWADIRPGDSVLDLGCGAGLDSLIAARRAGETGKVTGVDFSTPMLERARRAAQEGGTLHAEFVQSDAEKLPVPDESIDLAIVNGIFNLNPARTAIFTELARVIRSGGSLAVAELILREPLPPEVVASDASWLA